MVISPFKKIPKRIIVELTNKCNLRCPACKTWSHMRRPRGFMTNETFTHIIKELKGKVEHLSFDFAGEPMLHPDFFGFVSRAWYGGFKTSVCTNATTLRKIPPWLTTLTVCLDGSTWEAHTMYRRGSDFERVKYNITKMCENKGCTHVRVQCLLTSRSEHQIEDVKRLAFELGADSVVFKRMHTGHGLGTERLLPSDPTMRRKNKWRPICRSGLQTGLIYWDGRLGMCCVDFNNMGSMPNVMGRDIERLYASKDVARRRRRAFFKRYKECKTCELSGAGGLRWLEVRRDK